MDGIVARIKAWFDAGDTSVLVEEWKPQGPKYLVCKPVDYEGFKAVLDAPAKEEKSTTPLSELRAGGLGQARDMLYEREGGDS